MNTFLLRGPEFLGFYITLSAAVLAWCWIRFRAQGGGTKPRLTDLTSEPYRIAYLRDGSDEAIRVAVFNLVDRGIVKFESGALSLHRADAPMMLRNPLDRAITRQLSTPHMPTTLLHQADLIQACEGYAQSLERAGLLPDAPRRDEQTFTMLAAIGVLGGTALTKIVVAVSNGHLNVGFLLLLAVASCVCARTICKVRITPAGRRALAGLQNLSQRLRDRTSGLRAGGGTDDALLVACIFGIQALPYGTFPFAALLFPRPQPQATSGSSSSDSCSSSSCSSGGCGGGGGCGGCGS